MKSALVLAFPILAFVLIDLHPVTINGKPFGDAENINGVIAIRVEDLAKAIGGSTNLQHAGLQIHGATLSTLSPAVPAASPAAASSLTGSGRQALGSATGGAGAGRVAVHDISVTKRTDVSSALLFHEGRAWVPLADVAKAFGGNLAIGGPGTLRPGQSINLNFAPVQGAAFTVHQ